MSRGNCLQVVALMVAVSLACLFCITNSVNCQQNGGSSFGASRPAGSLFEPTLSFIRQNMRLVESYVALLRSIFVGAYDRPLITSTDAPSSATRGPSPVVPPMDLPKASSRD